MNIDSIIKMDYFLKCYIDYQDGTKDIINIDKVKKEDYAKVIKLRFWRLKSYQLETEAPQVYEMENLGHLETPDTEGDAGYSDKLGNLINLHTIKVGHIGTCNNNNSKCYTYKNRGLIKNYQTDTYISAEIEYLNLFLGWFSDDYNCDEKIITLLNNLHNGLKYLQINISDFDILKYINNLPITLETLKIVITHCPNMIFLEGDLDGGEEKYYKEANYAMDQIKTPFGCKKTLTILNLTS